MLCRLIVAHLAADFVVQTRWLVQRKRTPVGMALHIATVGLAMMLVAADQLAVPCEKEQEGLAGLGLIDGFLDGIARGVTADQRVHRELAALSKHPGKRQGIGLRVLQRSETRIGPVVVDPYEQGTPISRHGRCHPPQVSDRPPRVHLPWCALTS